MSDELDQAFVVVSVHQRRERLERSGLRHEQTGHDCQHADLVASGRQLHHSELFDSTLQPRLVGAQHCVGGEGHVGQHHLRRCDALQDGGDVEVQQKLSVAHSDHVLTRVIQRIHHGRSHSTSCDARQCRA